MKTKKNFVRKIKSESGSSCRAKTFGSAIVKMAGCLVFIALLNSCAPCYYAPNAQNVPLFREKKEANGTFSFQNGTISIGMNMQGALAVSDHIGIIANINHFSDKGVELDIDDEDYSTKIKGNTGELGVGYYLPFAKKFIFETYGGFGRTNIKTTYEWASVARNSTVKATSYFLQPAVGYYKKNVRLALSARFRVVDYRSVQYEPELDLFAQETLIDLQNNPTVCLIEPAFTFRAGGEHVKFQTQVGLSFLLGKDSMVIYDPLNVNFGIVFSIHRKKKPGTAQ